MENKFILQWHISEACNLKCKHCYQKNHTPIQLKYEELQKILKQYKELLSYLNIKGHINLTGGEPLCSPYFYKLIEQFYDDRELYSFSILTNGTLLTEENVEKIAKCKPEYVQVSLEGGKVINDYVRGAGVYKKVKQAIKILKQHKIYVSISFTATALNYKQFPRVVKFAKKNEVDNIWSDRFIPFGTKYDRKFILNIEQTQEYLNIMREERRKLKQENSKSNIAMYRALQFQKTAYEPYHCTAGSTLLTVMENGDLVPCRRMPIIIGNLLNDNMYELYKNNPILKDLQKESIPEECKMCDYSQKCRGGLKCLTYAVTGDYKKRDIGCNLLKS